MMMKSVGEMDLSGLIYASRALTKGTEMLCAWDRKGRRLHPYSQRCKERKVVNKHMAMRNERSVE